MKAMISTQLPAPVFDIGQNMIVGTNSKMYSSLDTRVVILFVNTLIFFANSYKLHCSSSERGLMMILCENTE